MEPPPRQRTLHGAVQSDNVLLLQRALRDAGYDPGSLDGVYGPDTAAAVQQLQQAEGLPADGIVGAQTWQTLAPLRKATLRGTLHGATGGEDVRRAQEALAAAGFPPGDIDGIYGYHTARAVRGFQDARKLPVDGIVGPETWAALLAPRVPREWAELVADSPTNGERPIAFLFYAGRDMARLVDLLALLRASIDLRDGELAIPPSAEELETADGMLVFVSEALLADERDVGVARAQEVARSSGKPLVPILVEPTKWSHSPLFEFQAAFEARPLSELDDLSPLAAAVVEVLGGELSSAAASLPKSYLPGYSADRARGVDLLGIKSRVDFLASVLAAKRLETPLAVGLFGDWGSGKSFFMERIQEQVARLSEESARAEQDGNPSYYCSHVRQVSFNAWLYSDSDIWPSLAAQVFRSVAGEPADAPAELREYRAGLRDAEARHQQAELEEAAYGRRIEELDAEIAAKRAAIAERAAALGGTAGDAARGVRSTKELGHRIARIVRGWRDLRPLDLLLLLTPLAYALVVFLVGVERVWALLALVSPLVLLAVRLIRYVDDTTQLQREANELAKRRDALGEQRAARAQEREEQERLLPSTRTVQLLPEYAGAQAARWAGRERLGVVTEIRLAFEELSGLIDESHGALEKGELSPREHLPIDRMIVYVDDLDRCSHDVVVRVLESIKVLLDLPHFVVVVGVDSRWLFRAIQIHFADVLRADGPGPQDDAWAMTPQNYLEKIFQYSLVLRPIDASGFERLMDSLLTVEAVSAPVGEPAPAATGPSPTEGQVEAPAPQEPDAAPEPAHAVPSGSAGGGRRSSDVDLTPGDLVITRPELEFMKRLAPLYGTPRAAKRLANVYRLLRVSVGADLLADPENYQPALLLLSVAIAFPALAGELMRAIPHTSASRWGEFVAGLNAKRDEDAAWTGAWRRLTAALGRIDDGDLGERPLDQFARWRDVVADFSFHPWQELLPAETQG